MDSHIVYPVVFKNSEGKSWQDCLRLSTNLTPDSPLQSFACKQLTKLLCLDQCDFSWTSLLVTPWTQTFQVLSKTKKAKRMITPLEKQISSMLFCSKRVPILWHCLGLRTVTVHTGYGCHMSAMGTVPWALQPDTCWYGYGTVLCHIGWNNMAVNGRHRLYRSAWNLPILIQSIDINQSSTQDSQSQYTRQCEKMLVVTPSTSVACHVLLFSLLSTP